MPKTPHTFKLSEQAERHIDRILQRNPHFNGNRTQAIEYALYFTDMNGRDASTVSETAPAARPARPKAATKETMK